MEKLFSIILPVYNVADYLDRCIRSVLAQSGDDYEVILVDDGSKDRSGIMCDEWSEKSSKIRVIHKPNGGLASARNTGLDNAVGKYALMVDSDDYIESTTLDVLRKAIYESSAEVIRFDYVMHTASGTIEKRTQCNTGLYNGENVSKQLLERVLIDPNSYQMSAWLHAYSIEFLNRYDLRFVSERIVLSEDFQFNLRMLQCAQSVFITDEVLYHYDMREGSLTHSTKPRMFERYTELYRQVKAFYESRNASHDLIRKLNCYYVYNLFYRTIVSYEYCDKPGRTWDMARRNVSEMLQNETLNECAKDMDESGLSFKERMKIDFIKSRYEPGLALAFRKGKKEIKS